MKMKKSLIILMAGIGLLTACQESSQTSSRVTVSLHANYIHPDRTEFQIGSEGGNAQFTVTSQDTPWAINSVPEWISVSPTSGSATANVSVSVPNYLWASPRVGIFALESTSADWSFSRSMTVTQTGALPYLDIDKLDFSFDGEANSESVRVSSNFDWNLSNRGNWISVSMANDQMTVSVPANESGEDRTGEVDIRFGNNVMATVRVTQLAAKVSLKTDPLNFEIGAGAYKLTIESEAPWRATSYYDWIEVSPSSGEPGKTEVTVSVTPNPYDGERDGFLYFNFKTSDYQIAEIPVHQDGIILEMTDSDEYLQNLPSLGGDQVFHLRSNTDWSIVQVPYFMTVSPMSGSGSTSLSVKLNENASFDWRSEVLSLRRQTTGYQRDYWMQQRPRTFESSSTWLDCNDLAQELYFDVKTEGGWQLQGPDYQGNDAFFTPSPMQSRGDGRITFSVAENQNYGSREGFVNFFLTGMDGYDGGLAQVSTIYVNQAGWQDKYQEVRQEIQLPSAGGTMSVDIATNDGWTAAFVSSASWIRVDGPASGKGAGSLTLAFDENKTVDARSVKVRVSFEHLDPVEFTVTQLGKAIRLSSDALYFFAKGGSITVVVDADGAYSVARASGDWFTVTPGDDNTFTVKADAYTGDAERSGSIVLKLTDLQTGSYTLTLPVMQTTSAGFTRGAWQEDRNLNIGTSPGFSIQVSGYSADQDWNGGRHATVGGEGYGEDENWN